MKIKEGAKRTIACGVATSLIAIGSADAAFASSPAPALPTVAKSTIALVDKAGFGSVNAKTQVKTPPASAVSLTPTLAVKLKPAARGVSSNGITINSPAADGTVTVSKIGGFGIVTSRHANLSYRFKTFSAPDTKIVSMPDGGLNELDENGQIIGRINPAYALDSTGASIPASYSYDSATHELVVKANTTSARGSVFIDPSWRCWATAGAYGVGWIVVAAAWVFTDGGAAWAAWALRAWFGLSYNSADQVAKACALH